MYELTFTDIHMCMDYVGKCSESLLIQLITDQLNSGLFLSGIRKLPDEQK